MQVRRAILPEVVRRTAVTFPAQLSAGRLAIRGTRLCFLGSDGLYSRETTALRA
jgi:hypothetical protein